MILDNIELVVGGPVSSFCPNLNRITSSLCFILHNSDRPGSHFSRDRDPAGIAKFLPEFPARRDRTGILSI